MKAEECFEYKEMQKIYVYYYALFFLKKKYEQVI